MYGYSSEHIPLTKHEILKRISQEEIFELVFGYKPQSNKYICSPFRNDSNPGAYFEWFKGELYFKDFADSTRIVRDAFQCIIDTYDCNFNQALIMVNEHFNLGIGSNNVSSVKYEIEISHTARNKCSSKKRNSEYHDIEIKSRHFTELDKKYWFDKYKIQKYQLIEDNVFPLIWYKFWTKEGDLITIRPSDIAFSYCEWENNHKKVYRPYCNTPKGKWTTNCTENDIGGIKSLIPRGHRLIITKSYKDWRILSNAKCNSIWFQNEGMIPHLDNIMPILKRFNEVVILFDNDTTGLAASQKVKDILQSLVSDIVIRSTHVPIPLLSDDITDPSDLLAKRGILELTRFLIETKIQQ